MKTPKTVIWDWNGTLADDGYASLLVVNDILAKREMDSIARLSEATEPAYLMLQGRMELKDNQYEQAAKQLEKAEQLARTTGSNYFMSGLYAMLEQCYREMEDFKKAYHYASMQLQIKE